MPLLALSLAAVLAQAPEPAQPQTGAPTPPVDKKQAYLDAKAEAVDPGRPARPGQRAEQPIWANNLRTHDIRVLTGSAGIAAGPAGQDARSEFFKCWFTLKSGPISTELLARVIATAEHFEVREIDIISGFRHPKYNLMLRKKGHEVATTSQHTVAKAIDFFLPGVETRPLYDWLLANHDGGVGYYPVSEFVHVDLGRKRTWSGT